MEKADFTARHCEAEVRSNLALKVLRKIRRAILRDEPTYYDMFLNSGERYFAQLYLHAIRQHLAAHPEPFDRLRAGFVEGERPLKLLDAGCQAGRLAVPLALDGHRVTGVDSSGVGLKRAAQHARQCGVSLTLVRAELSRWLARAPAGRFDAVICTEVLYLRPNHRQLLCGLLRVLRSGGLCFISHRPPAYYLVEALQRGDREAARTVLSGAEGKLFGSYYNWQDRGELEALYRENGVEVQRIVPIGLLSWLTVNPERLEVKERGELLETELASADACPGGGRYLLVIGRKR